MFESNGEAMNTVSLGLKIQNKTIYHVFEIEASARRHGGIGCLKEPKALFTLMLCKKIARQKCSRSCRAKKFAENL